MRVLTGTAPLPPTSRRGRVLTVAVVACAIGCAAYPTDIVTHLRGFMLSWYDLRVYLHGGEVARSHPAMLYVWRDIKFTYTPFAALLFAAGSLLPWTVLAAAMLLGSLAALAATVWLTFGALGWRGRPRLVATIVTGTAGLWSEPVQRGLHLGQVELILMLLIVWDLTRRDDHPGQGLGIGLAAGIKLVPLIFIPYLVLTGQRRQAGLATAVFGGTVLTGFGFLPAASRQFWLTGYFLNSGHVGGTVSRVNQSLLGFLARADGGNLAAAAPLWVFCALAVGVAGLLAAAALHRSGQPVVGWVMCAVTGLLISPISWDHHWLWIVPLLALLADCAVRGRAGTRRTWWALAGSVGLVFGAWPRYGIGPKFLLPMGLLGALPFAGPAGLGWLSDNLYVLSGLLVFAALLAAAVVAWQDRWAWPIRRYELAVRPEPAVARHG